MFGLNGTKELLFIIPRGEGGSRAGREKRVGGSGRDIDVAWNSRLSNLAAATFKGASSLLRRPRSSWPASARQSTR